MKWYPIFSHLEIPLIDRNIEKFEPMLTSKKPINQKLVRPKDELNAKRTSFGQMKKMIILSSF